MSERLSRGYEAGETLVLFQLDSNAANTSILQFAQSYLQGLRFFLLDQGYDQAVFVL